jgi:hypothetical protein
MKNLLTVMLVSGLTLVVPAMANQDAAKPAPAAKPAAPTQATSEGTVKLFVEAMKSGDFKRAVELSDQGSEEFENLQKMAEAFDPADPNNQVPDKKHMLDVVRDAFTRPWKDVEVKLVAEQGTRAQYTLSIFYIDEKTKERKKSEDRTMDLNQFEGRWSVLVSSQLMKPVMPANMPVAPPPAPTAPSAPAEKPAEKK